MTYAFHKNASFVMIERCRSQGVTQSGAEHLESPAAPPEDPPSPHEARTGGLPTRSRSSSVAIIVALASLAPPLAPVAAVTPVAVPAATEPALHTHHHDHPQQELRAAPP
jgi:hypothetical protein